MRKLPDFARNEVLEALERLADPEFQAKVWVRGEGSEISSPDELVCQLYDDTALDLCLRSSGQEPVFSEEVDAILREISARLDEMDLSVPAERLLRESKWLSIQDLAKRAVDLVRAGS